MMHIPSGKRMVAKSFGHGSWRFRRKRMYCMAGIGSIYLKLICWIKVEWLLVNLHNLNMINYCYIFLVLLLLIGCSSSSSQEKGNFETTIIKGIEEIITPDSHPDLAF